MRISAYRSEKDNAPRAVEASWSDLAEALGRDNPSPCTLETCAGKKCPHKLGRAWSPAEVDGRRANENVRAISVAVFDLDDVPDDEWRQRIAGHRAIVHSTHGHRDGAPRLRLVLELSRPVPREQWPVAWAALVDRFAPGADKACKDLARLYFLPTRPSDAPRVFETFDGAPVDVEAITTKTSADAPLLAETPSAPITPRKQYPGATPEVLAAAREALEHHGPAIQGQGGDAHTLTAAMKLRHDFALTPDEALPLLLLWNLTCVPPWDEADLRRKSRDDYGHATGLYGAARERLPGGIFAPLPFDPELPGGVDPTPHQPGSAAGAPLASEVAARDRTALRKYLTEFAQLNPLIGGGWISRTLSIILGPPGAGKTAFMIGAAIHAVNALKLPVLYCCTELESEEIVARIAAQLLGKTWSAIEDGTVPQALVAEVLAGKRIHVFGSEGLAAADAGVAQIEAEAKRLAGIYGVAPLVIVDYLQDMSRGGDVENARGRISDLVTKLRALAQVCDCVVLCVSSVSRKYYGQEKADSLRSKDDAASYLAAAKESGDVDYAAATVMFLDVENDDGKAERFARIAVAKARRGRTGFAGARFAGASGQWTDDPAALVAMSPDARKTARKDEAASEVETRVLRYMRESGVALTVTQIRANVTGGSDAIGHAVERLVERKVVKNCGGKFIVGTLKPIEP